MPLQVRNKNVLTIYRASFFDLVSRRCGRRLCISVLLAVLKDGVIVEQGKHTELMERGGIYSSLAKAQNLGDVFAEEEKGQEVGFTSACSYFALKYSSAARLLIFCISSYFISNSLCSLFWSALRRCYPGHLNGM